MSIVARNIVRDAYVHVFSRLQKTDQPAHLLRHVREHRFERGDVDVSVGHTGGRGIASVPAPGISHSDVGRSSWPRRDSGNMVID